MKQKLRIIIRGFLYRTNWTPLSSRKDRNSDYTIDFLQCQDGYIKLINKLKQKYEVSVYFSTYDTTPKKIIKSISNTFDSCIFFLSSETGSSQFTTSKFALDSLPSEENCLNMLLRSDMRITDLFIDSVCNAHYTGGAIHVLCEEKNKKKPKKVIDVIQLFYDGKIRQLLQKEINRLPKHLHYIYDQIKTNSIVNQENSTCVNTELCKDYFRIYPQ